MKKGQNLNIDCLVFFPPLFLLVSLCFQSLMVIIFSFHSSFYLLLCHSTHVPFTYSALPTSFPFFSFFLFCSFFPTLFFLRGEQASYKVASQLQALFQPLLGGHSILGKTKDRDTGGPGGHGPLKKFSSFCSKICITLLF